MPVDKKAIKTGEVVTIRDSQGDHQGTVLFHTSSDLIKQLEAFVGLKTLKEQMAMFAKGIFMQRRVGRSADMGGGGAAHEGFLYKLGITKKTEPVVVQRGDLVSKYIGQTTEMTRRKINQSKGGVMLVDEAYRLQQTDSSSRDVGREALEEIMSVMEDGDPIMIFAGYPALSVNPGMKSRIAYTFPFPDFSVEELANIINVEWHSSPP
ncbi:PREDICTED: protein CfxQ homolog [Branchiostoma belcheri]|uniref:Protein CfxQ homolog n=1 Tax=Branchiostoma belcheri TaxID=7741 RepID=A0A6P4Z069_BRABE|nr:PREDICTED: protein CfxQ homolog [Branchiostoma belcheri]